MFDYVVLPRTVAKYVALNNNVYDTRNLDRNETVGYEKQFAREWLKGNQLYFAYNTRNY